MDAEREKKLQELNVVIRALLMSSSRGVMKHRLGSDYREYMGKSMNETLRQLGYRSVDEYVQDNRSVVREAVGPTGEPTYFAVATSETQHVAKLISQQKKPSLKKMARPPPPRPHYQSQKKFHNSVPLPRTQQRKGRFQGKGSQKYHSVGHTYSRQVDQQREFGNFARSAPLLGSGNPPHSSITKWQPPFKSHSVLNQKPGIVPQYNQSGTRLNVTPNRRYGLGSTASVASGSPSSLQPNCPDSKGSVFAFSSTSSPGSPPDQAQGIPRWREEFKRVDKTFRSVAELKNSEDQYDQKLICVSGFPGGFDKVKQVAGECRILLSDSPELHHAVDHAVNLFFQKPRWDIGEYPDPLRVCSYEGVKLKVVGQLRYKLWQRWGKKRHSIAVVYYERMPQPLLPLTVTVSNSGDSQWRREVVKMERSMSSSSSSINSSTSSSSHDAGSSGRVDSETQQWLKKILSDRPNGLWFKIICKSYEEKFHRQCSFDSFQESISSLDFIRMDTDVPGNPIVHLVKEREPPAVTQFPDREEFPPDSEWIDVFVVCASSPQEFFVQLASDDRGKAFQSMTTEMNKFFSASDKEAAPLKMGEVLSSREEKLFASAWEDEQEVSWCRTIVEGPSSSESLVMVYYPDYGNSGELEITELRRLPAEFYKLPFQSIPCYLDGVSEDSQEAVDHFNKLAFEKSGVVRVNKRDEKTGVDLLVNNQSIKTALLNALHPVETLVPSIPQSGRVAVKLTDVDKSQDKLLAVQVIGLGTEWLAELNEILKATIHKGMKAARMFGKGEVTVGTVCCCIREDQCYRVRVMEVLVHRVLVEYLDYGNKELVEATSLRKKLDGEQVCKLPPQAVRCSLHGIPPREGVVTDKVVNLLGDYFEADNLELEMVAEGGCLLWEGDTNINDLLLANKDNFILENLLSSATNSVSESSSSSSPMSLVDSESSPFQARQCFTPDAVGASDSQVQRSQSLLSPKSAPFIPQSPTTPPLSLGHPFSPCRRASTPPDPLPDELFCDSSSSSNLVCETLEDHGDPVRLVPTDVRSPYEFTVQLQDNGQRLEEMQTHLQKHCNSPLSRTLSEYSVGIVCAARSRIYRGWYRAVLTDTLIVRNEGGKTVQELSVKYVDYGNIETVSALEVKVLPKSFLDLPFQGITARLSQVVPIGVKSSPEKDWSPQACSRFEELLFDKEQTLYGMAIGQIRGIYSVRLIQVPSGDLIGELLVKDGLARAV